MSSKRVYKVEWFYHVKKEEGVTAGAYPHQITVVADDVHDACAKATKFAKKYKLSSMMQISNCAHQMDVDA